MRITWLALCIPMMLSTGSVLCERHKPIQCCYLFIYFLMFYYYYFMCVLLFLGQISCLPEASLPRDNGTS